MKEIEKAQGVEIKILDIPYTIYPFADSESARVRIDYAQDRFRETFGVRRFGEGFIVVSGDMALDAKNHEYGENYAIVHRRRVFREIMEMSKPVD